MSTSNY